MSEAQVYEGPWKDPNPEPPVGPHNIEVEQALLGALLINNDLYARVASTLSAEHFYDPVHARIYGVIGDRIAAGEVADFRTTKGSLVGKVGDITISEYLTLLAREAVSGREVASYARTVRNLSARRRLLEVAESAAAAALEAPEQAIGPLLEKIEGDFADLREGHRIEGLTFSPSAAVDEAMQMIGDAHSGKRVGWPWFLPEVSSVMDGPTQSGNLYGLLGASGDGKTSLILQQLRFSAAAGVPFLFLSGEQERSQCVLQMHSQALGIEVPVMLRRNGLTQEEADRIYEDAGVLAALPWAVEKWSSCTVAQLGVKVRAFVKRFGPGIVAIDNARKVVPNNPKANLADQVFQVFSDVKDLMGSTGCSGIILMQRNSDFLRRRNMAPMRSDCYGGEGTLQNLDSCLTVFQPPRWLAEAAKRAERDSDRRKLEDDAVTQKGRAQVGTLKVRFGEEGRFRDLKFINRFTRFVSEAQERAAEEPELV